MTFHEDCQELMDDISKTDSYRDNMFRIERLARAKDEVQFLNRVRDCEGWTITGQERAIRKLTKERIADLKAGIKVLEGHSR